MSGAWLEDNPRAATLLTFVAGAAAGLVGAPGWWLFPVSWSEAQPYHLRQDLRVYWVQLVANDYQGNGQLDKAAERLASMDAATLITEFEACRPTRHARPTSMPTCASCPRTSAPVAFWMRRRKPAPAAPRQTSRPPQPLQPLTRRPPP